MELFERIDMIELFKLKSCLSFKFELFAAQ